MANPFGSQEDWDYGKHASNAAKKDTGGIKKVKSVEAKEKKVMMAKKYITAPSGRKFEITKSKSMGHQNIDFKHN